MNEQSLHPLKQDLIENDSFIRWVQSEFEEDQDYWSSFIDQHIEQMDEINEAIHFVRQLQFSERKHIDGQKLWDRIAVHTQKTVAPKIVSIKTIRYFVGLAAACLIVLFIYRSGISKVVEVRSNVGEELVEVLPDGSKVTLNAASAITFSPKKWATSRFVHLEGKAFFEVKSGSSFVVETKAGNVTVLGTSFVVDTRENGLVVFCKTGKVAVRNNNKQEVLLTPGEKASVVNDAQIEKTLANEAKEISWMDGVFQFENETLDIVIKEIERQYAVQIHVSQEVAALKYTGFFKSGSLEQALYAITWPIQLKYRIENQQVFITR